MLGNLDKNDNFLQCVPIFYRKLFVCPMKQAEEVNHSGNQTLWLNKNITIGRENVFCKEWHENGITLSEI